VTKSIEDIAVGDLVLSRDQYDAGDDLDPRRVTNVFRKTSDHLRILTIRGDGGNVETIRTTNEHPFWVEGAGWTAAGDLSVGATLDQPDGTDAVVLSSVYEAHPEGIAVFNFEVEGDHTYFVEDGNGTTAIWTHNWCIGGKFVARIKGRAIEFKNAVAVRWTKLPEPITRPLRDAFEGTVANKWRDGVKAEWLRSIASDSTKRATLLEAGLTKHQIDRMRLGDGPGGGWSVHHKQPIEVGGTNDFENLLLIKDRWHTPLSVEQNRLMAGANDFQTIDTHFPLFDGLFIYDRV
jgi:hypothetical protein